MSLNDYVKAQKLGEKRYQAALSKNEYPYLPVLDELITNFHLPESTLLMLVSALAGKDFIMKAYEEAVKEKYRFFSFGDAMFIADLNKEGVRAE